MSDYQQAFQQTTLGKDQLDDAILTEFVQDFSGGEDSFRRAVLLDPNQSQHLQNVIVRDNFEARTRPGADSLPTASTLPIAGATAVYSLRYFDTPTYQQLLVSLAAGGNAKFLKFEANAWTDLSGSYTPSTANARLEMAQGVNQVLIADGSANQLTAYNGTIFTGVGTNTQYDAPIGSTILKWHTSRMFASGQGANSDTIYVSVFGPLFVPKGTIVGGNPYAGDWDQVNRSFRVGSGDGDPIIALAPMQAFVLAVLKRNSIWLVTTDPAKDTSTSTPFTAVNAQAVSQNIAYGIGCVGRDAWCAYGNDVLFMAQDGVRSVQRMQAAAGQWQLSAPLSQPIQPYIDRINRSAWSGIRAIKYEEFAFFAVPLDNSSTNNYVLVWNGRLGKWMGAWTNWTALCFEQTRFNGIVRLVFGDNSGHVNQWKDYLGTNSVTDDATYFDNGAGYPTQIWSRSFQFGDAVLNKQPYNAIIRFTSGNATVNLTWTADLSDARGWVGQEQPIGDILGVGTLPFLLQSIKPKKINKGLRGLPSFNEGYLKVETTSGWFFLRSVAVGAMMNPLKEVTA